MASSATQSQTGTPNQVYDLVSILYHCLEGSQTYQKYLDDAQQIGDQELVSFIKQVIQQDNQRAEQAKQLLQKQLSH